MRPAPVLLSLASLAAIVLAVPLSTASSVACSPEAPLQACFEAELNPYWACGHAGHPRGVESICLEAELGNPYWACGRADLARSADFVCVILGTDPYTGDICIWWPNSLLPYPVPLGVCPPLA